MFGSKKNTTTDNTSSFTPSRKDKEPASGINSRNQIGKDTKVIGEIQCVGNIRLDGALEGKLTCESKVVIGETGVIVGDIDGQSADISGRVEGNIKIKESLFLRDTAVIEGEIVTGKLIVDSGAVLNCTISMDSEKFGKSNSKDFTGGKQAQKANS